MTAFQRSIVMSTIQRLIPVLPIVGALLLSANAEAVPEAHVSLDGQRYMVKVTERGNAKTDLDLLIFENGRFKSPNCDPYGFGSAPYRTAKDGGEVRFDSSIASAKEGT